MSYRFKTKPFKHQEDCFEINKNRKFFAELMEMGTGKSKVLLDTAAYMYDQGWINALHIFGNKGSYMNWLTNEIPEHFPEHIPIKTGYWKASMNKKEELALESMLKESFFGLKIFVQNIESMAYDRSVEVAKKFVSGHRTLVTVDESSTIKNHTAKRTKAMLKLRDLAKVRRILTGSLVDNRPLDAYSQFEFLNPACLGFSSFYSFRAQYAEMIDMNLRNSTRPVKVVKGFKNIEDLKNRISKHSFIIKKEDCLDLPPKVYQTFNVELTDEQIKHYNDLKLRCMTEVGQETVSVRIVLTKLMRLHQLVCGHLKDDEGSIHKVANNRMAALLDLLEESSGQVIIWANYREDIKDIAEAIGKEYGVESVLTYFGDTTEEERAEAKRSFRNDEQIGEARFLVANPQTGGYGLTLNGASTVIYYSNSFDAEKRNQSEDRCHRYGQTKSVTYIDIVAKDTIDEKILKVLKDKKALSEAITVSNWQTFL